MRDSYPQRNSGFFSLLGYLFAVVLVVGFLSKAGIKFNLPGKEPAKGTTEELSIQAATLDRPAGFTPLNDEDKLVLPPAGETAESYSATLEERSGTPGSSASNSKRWSKSEWIANFSTPAIREALANGIPAGISLAVGIAKVEDGYAIGSLEEFRELVIQPLLKIKNRSSDNQYFKYAANSQKWARGLGKKPGYSEKSLIAILEKYDLTDLDLEVKAHLADESLDPETRRKADFVGEEVGSRIREKRRSSRSDDEPALREEKSTEDWKAGYDEVVGQEVAREIAKKKLKSRSYISEEEMNQLVEETNVETEKTIKNRLAFPGRKLNPNNKNASDKLDITQPGNSQAREELYQRKIAESKKKRT